MESSISHSAYGVPPYGVPQYGPPRYGAEGGPMGARAETLNFPAMLRVLRRRLGVIGLIVALGAVLSALYALSLEKQYIAASRILIAAPETQILAPDRPGFLLTDENFIDTQVEVIGSTEIMERVVDRLGLMQSPEFNPSLQDSSVTDYLNPMAWIGALRGAVSGLLTGGDGGAGTGGSPTQKVIEELRSRVNVERVDLTYIISVAAISNDPAMAQRIANAVADQYLASQLNTKFEASDRANTLLAERLRDLRTELLEKEQTIEQYRAENDLADLGAGGTTLNEQFMSDLNEQLAITRADIAEKEARLRLVENLLKSRANAESIGEVLGSATIISLRNNQAEVIRRRAELSTRYKPTHPQMIQVTRELEDLEAQIRREVKLIVENLANEVDISRERERSLEATIDQHADRLAGKAEAISTLRDLERDADATRQIYQTFLARSKEVAERKDTEQLDARIMSSAKLPIRPFRPKRAVIVLTGTALAAFFAVAFVLAVDALAAGIRTPDEMESALGLTHLASVPRIASASDTQRPYRYMLRNPLSGFTEVYRTLLATITLSDRERMRHVVLFTSALPSEGKTTNALCFALAAARSGKRTVLIEADLRMPKVAWQLDLQGEHSLTEVLRGDVSLGGAIATEPETGLSVLAMRRAASDPSTLLASNAFQELLSALKEHFDVIVLDTAPILPVGDTLQLAPLADHVVFVVRARKTARGDVAMALKELSAVKANILGGVITFADTSNRRAYGYGNYGQPSGPGAA